MNRQLRSYRRPVSIKKKGKEAAIKKHTRKHLNPLYITIVALVFVAFFYLLYLDYRTNNYLVFSEKSPDQKYTLNIYQIALPIKPYGNSTIRARLDEGDRKVVEYEYFISCDGLLLNEEFFETLWDDDHVEILNDEGGNVSTTLVFQFNGGLSIYYGGGKGSALDEE